MSTRLAQLFRRLVLSLAAGVTATIMLPAASAAKARDYHVDVLRGGDAIMTYGQPEATTCTAGSAARFYFPSSERHLRPCVHVPIGPLKDGPVIKASMHTVGSKAARFDLTDDLPQQVTFPID